MNNRIIISILLALLFVSSTFTFVNARSLINSDSFEPIDIFKYVLDPDTQEWVDFYEADLDEIVTFKIDIIYHSNCQDAYMATDIVIIDCLPEDISFLGSGFYNISYINGSMIYWNLTDDYNISLYDNESVSLVFNASIDGYGEYVNHVQVNAWETCCSWPLFGESYATVYVPEPPAIEFEKLVWDEENQSWVDLLDKVQIGVPIRFKIVIKYLGFDDIDLMKCMVVEDFLPDCCLEYVVGSEEFLYPSGLFEDPDIVVSENLNYVKYDWSNKMFNLFIGETLEIEFEAVVVFYCFETVENYAFIDMWSCYNCQDPVHIYGLDYAYVYCYPQDSIFEKTVWDTDLEKWVESINTYIGRNIRFKIDLTYFGNFNLTNIVIVDKLPDALDYAYNADPIETNVSEDLKTIIWAFDNELSDGETFEIQFDALAVDITCGESGLNSASVTANYSSDLQEQFVAYDTAGVVTAANNPPCSPDVDGDKFGRPGDSLSYFAISCDPNNDDIFYLFDWGDGLSSEWVGPFNTCEEVELKHSWANEGEYMVKVKAKDIVGDESDWSSYPIIVKIESEPVEPVLDVTIKKGFSRGIKINLENTGDVDVEEISWSLIVKKGIFKKIVFNAYDEIPFLSVGDIETVAGYPFGIGMVTINVKVDAFNLASIEKTVTGFIFLRFVIVK